MTDELVEPVRFTGEMTIGSRSIENNFCKVGAFIAWFCNSPVFDSGLEHAMSSEVQEVQYARSGDLNQYGGESGLGVQLLDCIPAK